MATIFAGCERRLIREHNGRVSLAWHIAALQRVSPRKRLPPLRKLMVDEPGPRRPPQSWQDQKAVIALWTAALGGTVSQGPARAH
jgi:hypothetical protein